MSIAGGARLVGALLDRIRPPRHRGDRDGGVYLTFDDGPAEPFTALLADALERRGHRGTFFVTGARAERHPERVRALRRAGHAVGSHSHTHPRGWLTPPLTLLRDYRRGHRAVATALGERPSLFRPPYGHLGLAARAAAILGRSELVLWSRDSEDWRPGASAEDIVRTVAPALEPGAIILLHDWIVDDPRARDRRATLAALSVLLDLVEARGLSARALGHGGAGSAIDGGP